MISFRKIATTCGVLTFASVVDLSGAVLMEEHEIAKNRKAGARGLRATLESVMLDIMFEVPSIEGLTEVVITEDVVRLHRSPDYNVVEELGLSGS